MMYIAHTRDDGKKQPLLEHLHKTAEIAAGFAKLFSKSDLAFVCGLLHDIGKYSEEFQNRINHNGKLCDHSTAGAVLLHNQNEAIGKFLGYIITGHHSGLLNGGGWGAADTDKSLYSRLKKEIPDYSGYKYELDISQKLMIHMYAQQISNIKYPSSNYLGYSLSFLIRMIYSCLVDADFLDTEQFMSEDIVERGIEHNFCKLQEKLITHANSFVIKSFIDERRKEILSKCLERAKNNTGVFKLTVPTGGGKTISSMAFALQHIKEHPQLRRVIYVIPFTSIIEQNAKVFSKILGDEYILEHHSNYDFNDTVDSHYDIKKLATENWDMPIVVTTNVQFFESVYGNKSSRLRKLHNMSNSLIILDEVQMLPTEHIIPCVKVLEELVRNYNCTVILCSATQPDVERFMSDDIQITEICDNTEELYYAFNKTQARFIGNKAMGELVSLLKEKDQSLTIVNTKKQAKKLFEQLEVAFQVDTDGLFHLSTYMCPQNRHNVIEDIKNRLDDGRRCIVVATSLIEAGVDVDFPVVFRAMCGLDSIIQAAGRCNRERKQDLAYVNVFDFEEEDYRVKNTSAFGNYLRQRQSITEIIVKRYEDVMAPQAIKEYFNMLFGNLDQSELDKKRIVERLNQGYDKSTPKDFIFDFEDIAQDFQMIDDSSCAVIVKFNEEAMKRISHLEYGGVSKNTLRSLQKYTVNLSTHEYAKLKEIGAINEFGENMGILRSAEDYSNKTGIQIMDQMGTAHFA